MLLRSPGIVTNPPMFISSSLVTSSPQSSPLSLSSIHHIFLCPCLPHSYPPFTSLRLLPSSSLHLSFSPSDLSFLLSRTPWSPESQPGTRRRRSLPLQLPRERQRLLFERHHAPPVVRALQFGQQRHQARLLQDRLLESATTPRQSCAPSSSVNFGTRRSCCAVSPTGARAASVRAVPADAARRMCRRTLSLRAALIGRVPNYQDSSPWDPGAVQCARRGHGPRLGGSPAPAKVGEPAAADAPELRAMQPSSRDSINGSNLSVEHPPVLGGYSGATSLLLASLLLPCACAMKTLHCLQKRDHLSEGGKRRPLADLLHYTLCTPATWHLRTHVSDSRALGSAQACLAPQERYSVCVSSFRLCRRLCWLLTHP